MNVCAIIKRLSVKRSVRPFPDTLIKSIPSISLATLPTHRDTHAAVSGTSKECKSTQLYLLDRLVQTDQVSRVQLHLVW